jgi:hypothetical protein
MAGTMQESWPNLLLHDLLGVMLGWLVLEIWQQWRAVRRFEQRWPRELASQRRRKALAESDRCPAWLNDRCVANVR